MRLTATEEVQCGIFWVDSPDGRQQIPCHPMGDQYALDIINGVIPLEVAIARENDAERHFQQMEGQNK